MKLIRLCFFAVLVGIVLHADAQRSPVVQQQIFANFQSEVAKSTFPITFHRVQDIPAAPSFPTQSGARSVYDTLIIPASVIDFSGNAILTLGRSITNNKQVPVKFRFSHMPESKEALYDYFRSQLTNPLDTALSSRELMQRILPTWIKNTLRYENGALPWGGIWTDSLGCQRQADPVGNVHSMFTQSCGHSALLAMAIVIDMGYMPKEFLRKIAPPNHSVLEAFFGTWEMFDYDTGTPFLWNGSSATEIWQDTSRILDSDLYICEGSAPHPVEQMPFYREWLASGQPDTNGSNYFYKIDENVSGWFILPPGGTLSTGTREVWFLDLSDPDVYQFLMVTMNELAAYYESSDCDSACKQVLLDSVVTIVGGFFPGKPKEEAAGKLFTGGMQTYESAADQGRPISVEFSREEKHPRWRFSVDLTDTARIGEDVSFPLFMLEADQAGVVGSKTITGPIVIDLVSSGDTSPYVEGVDANYVTSGTLYPGHNELVMMANEHPHALSRAREWKLIFEGATEDSIAVQDESFILRFSAITETVYDEPGITVYPNPTNGRLHALQEGVLIDACGRVVCPIHKGDNDLEPGISNGVYAFRSANGMGGAQIIIVQR